MNIREREIILRLRSENPGVRSRQAEELFYGKGEDTKRLREEFNKIARYCFQGPKYHGMHSDIYNTLVSLVCEAILEAKESSLEGARDLTSYFFKIARNCANGKRRFIDQSLGINDRDVSLDAEGSMPVAGEDPNVDDGGGLLAVLLYGEDIPTSDLPSRKEMAVQLLERYMSGISCEKYRKVLDDVDVKGWSHERIEKEHGIDNIDQNHRRARLALIRAVLPEIRKNCADYYRHHRSAVEPEDADILDRFFDGEGSLPGNAVAKAYSRLVKVVGRDRADFNKAMKRRAREEKAALKTEKEAERMKGARTPTKKTE